MVGVFLGIVVCAVIVLLILDMLKGRMHPSVQIGIGVLLALWGALLLFGLVPRQMRKGELAEACGDLAAHARELKKDLDDLSHRNKPAGGEGREESERKLFDVRDRAGRLQDEAREVVFQAEEADERSRTLSGLLLVCLGWFAVQTGRRRKKDMTTDAIGKEKGSR